MHKYTCGLPFSSLSGVYTRPGSEARPTTENSLALSGEFMDSHTASIISKVLIDKSVLDESHIGCHCCSMSCSKLFFNSLLACYFQLLALCLLAFVLNVAPFIAALNYSFPVLWRPHILGVSCPFETYICISHCNCPHILQIWILVLVMRWHSLSERTRMLGHHFLHVIAQFPLLCDYYYHDFHKICWLLDKAV